MSGKHHQHNEQYTVSDFLHPTVGDCVRISAKGFSSEKRTRMMEISKWFQNCRRDWYFKSIVDIWHFDVNNQPLLYWEMVNTPDHWLLVTHCVVALHVDQSTTADSQREGTLVQQQHWAAAWQRPVGRTYSDYQRTPGWARPVAATGSEAREARLLASGTTLAPLVLLDYWHLAAYVTEQKFHHETRLILMSVLDWSHGNSSWTSRDPTKQCHCCSVHDRNDTLV